MKTRIRQYEEESPLGMLLLRQRLGLRRYRKTARRDPEEKRILLELGLRRIQDAEKDDYVSIGFRRRKVNIRS